MEGLRLPNLTYLLDTTMITDYSLQPRPLHNLIPICDLPEIQSLSAQSVPVTQMFQQNRPRKSRLFSKMPWAPLGTESHFLLIT